MNLFLQTCGLRQADIKVVMMSRFSKFGPLSEQDRKMRIWSDIHSPFLDNKEKELHKQEETLLVNALKKTFYGKKLPDQLKGAIASYARFDAAICRYGHCNDDIQIIGNGRRRINLFVGTGNVASGLDPQRYGYYQAPLVFNPSTQRQAAIIHERVGDVAPKCRNIAHNGVLGDVFDGICFPHYLTRRSWSQESSGLNGFTSEYSWLMRNPIPVCPICFMENDWQECAPWYDENGNFL